MTFKSYIFEMKLILFCLHFAKMLSEDDEKKVMEEFFACETRRRERE
jgi:hypothetical protein